MAGMARTATIQAPHARVKKHHYRYRTGTRHSVRCRGPSGEVRFTERQANVVPEALFMQRQLYVASALGTDEQHQEPSQRLSASGAGRSESPWPVAS